jgi:hypothetical protein
MTHPATSALLDRISHMEPASIPVRRPARAVDNTTPAAPVVKPTAAERYHSDNSVGR